MIRTGLEARCDRCGLREFYSDAKTLGDVIDNKWKLIGNKGLLCPECANIYDKRTEQFFNEIIYK